MVLLGFRTKLKLNNLLHSVMSQHAGYSRWVYNWGLALKEKAYRDGVKVSENQLKRFYTNSVKPYYPWMNTLSSRVYQYAFIDLANGYRNFFAGRSQKPKFKKKNRDDRFTIDGSGKPIIIGGTRIKLPFIGWVRTFEPLPECTTKKVTISRLAGDWYISFAYEQQRLQPQLKNETIGCDLGVKDWLTLSNGEVFPSLKPYQQARSQLSLKQYRHRNKAIGSANWRKAQIKIARLHRRVANIRRDYIHKLTSYLAKNFKRIVIEDLKDLRNSRINVLSGLIGKVYLCQASYNSG